MGIYDTMYGYGVRMDDLQVCDYKENGFLDLVKEYNLYLDLDLEENEDLTNYDCMDAIEEYENSFCETGIGALLSDIAYSKGIDLKAITDCNGIQYLVVLQDFPWNYSEKMRTMTSRNIDNYIERLLRRITDKKLEIKTWSIEENYG